MFTTIEQLLEESSRLSNAQPQDFQETLMVVNDNAVDPSILELINIISTFDEYVFVSSTRV